MVNYAPIDTKKYKCYIGHDEYGVGSVYERGTELLAGSLQFNCTGKTKQVADFGELEYPHETISFDIPIPRSQVVKLVKSKLEEAIAFRNRSKNK